jgi:hypothetical protein
LKGKKEDRKEVKIEGQILKGGKRRKEAQILKGRL